MTKEIYIYILVNADVAKLECMFRMQLNNLLPFNRRKLNMRLLSCTYFILFRICFQSKWYIPTLQNHYLVNGQDGNLQCSMWMFYKLNKKTIKQPFKVNYIKHIIVYWGGFGNDYLLNSAGRSLCWFIYLTLNFFDWFLCDMI